MKHKLKIPSIIFLIALVLSVGVCAEITVYTTKTGKKYHSAKDCTGLNSANNIYSETESSAKSKGLTRCSICWSSQSSSSKQTASKTTAKTAVGAKKVKLYSKAKSVKKGKNLKIKLLNNTKKVIWSTSNKRLRIAKKTNKYAIVKGLKKGNVILKAKVGKKIYKIKLLVK